MSYRCYGKKIIAAGLLALSKYRLATRVRLSILCVLTDWGGGGRIANAFSGLNWQTEGKYF